MTFPRLIVACFAASAILVGPAPAVEEPTTEPRLHDMISRLDKTLERLDQIDRRVERIEKVLFLFRLQPDKHGIIRDASGRPVGAWGIDYPMIEERAR